MAARTALTLTLTCDSCSNVNSWYADTEAETHVMATEDGWRAIGLGVHLCPRQHAAAVLDKPVPEAR